MDRLNWCIVSFKIFPLCCNEVCVGPVKVKVSHYLLSLLHDINAICNRKIKTVQKRLNNGLYNVLPFVIALNSIQVPIRLLLFQNRLKAFIRFSFPASSDLIFRQNYFIQEKSRQLSLTPRPRNILNVSPHRFQHILENPFSIFIYTYLLRKYYPNSR